VIVLIAIWSLIAAVLLGCLRMARQTRRDLREVRDHLAAERARREELRDYVAGEHERLSGCRPRHLHSVKGE
jgi:predicted secreted Zn-dependent protease